METQGDQKIPREKQTSIDLEDVQNELNLFDGSTKGKNKYERGDVEKESNHSEDVKDVPILTNPTNKPNEKKMATNNNKLPLEDEIFRNIFQKIQSFANQLRAEIFTKDIFILERDIFFDLFNLIEQHQATLTDDQITFLKRGFGLFIYSTDRTIPHEVFATYLSYAKKDIFYLYFNLMNLSMVQNYLKNTEMPSELESICRYSVSRILLVMRYSGLYTDLTLNDEQRPNNSVELLASMLQNVKADLESADLAINPSANDPSITRCLILTFLWDYSDKTILVEDLVEAGCSQILIDGLTRICKTENVIYDLQVQILAILHNISRHDDGIKELNDLNAATLIKVFQSKNRDNVLNTSCCMILALLLTPEQIKSEDKCIDDILDKLLTMIYLASLSSTNRVDGYHLSEILVVFVKLFNDDRMLEYIMKHSKVDLHTSTKTEFFINLLISYYSKDNQEDSMREITYSALVNILWSLSFQENYKQQLKNTSLQFQNLLPDFMTRTNEQISPNQYVPQYLESLQKAATGLLFNINQMPDPVTEQGNSTSTELDKNGKAMIMISYSHRDIEFCKQLHSEISKRGYNIWVDFEYLKVGDLWEQIAVGMKRANVIVCLMSENYSKSKSCRWEATYALDKLRATKSVIPVFLQQPELPDWLDIRVTLLKYVRFRDLTKLESDKFVELIDMIEYSLSSTETPEVRDLYVSTALTHEHLMKPSPTELNRFFLQSNSTLPTHQHPSLRIKPTIKKVEHLVIPSNNTTPIPRFNANSSHYSEKIVEEWDENDIYHWFEENEILPELRDLCRFKDGCELIIYARIFLDTEKLQYQMYSEEFLRHDGITSGQKPLLLHQFTKFSNALRKLKKFKRSM